MIIIPDNNSTSYNDLDANVSRLCAYLNTDETDCTPISSVNSGRHSGNTNCTVDMLHGVIIYANFAVISLTTNQRQQYRASPTTLRSNTDSVHRQRGVAHVTMDTSGYKAADASGRRLEFSVSHHSHVYDLERSLCLLSSCLCSDCNLCILHAHISHLFPPSPSVCSHPVVHTQHLKQIR